MTILLALFVVGLGYFALAGLGRWWSRWRWQAGTSAYTGGYHPERGFARAPHVAHMTRIDWTKLEARVRREREAQAAAQQRAAEALDRAAHGQIREPYSQSPAEEGDCD